MTINSAFCNQTYTRFKDIPLFKYDLIMADMPWRFETYSDRGNDRSAAAHYDTMTTKDIWDLKIGEWMGPNSILWLWAIWPMLPEAMACAEKYSLTYVTGGSWAKLSPKSHLGEPGAKQHMGMGYTMRGSCEPFLIFKCGRPETTNGVLNSIIAPVGQHSEKPAKAYELAERLMPNATRLELFSRAPRAGWDVFGDQVGVLGPEYKARGFKPSSKKVEPQLGFDL